jgi:hypothetical protein
MARHNPHETQLHVKSLRHELEQQVKGVRLFIARRVILPLDFIFRID